MEVKEVITIKTNSNQTVYSRQTIEVEEKGFGKEMDWSWVEPYAFMTGDTECCVDWYALDDEDCKSPLASWSVRYEDLPQYYEGLVLRAEAELRQSEMAHVCGGVFIETSESMIAQQATWADEDEGNGINFTQYPYWVTTDDGQEPEGFDSVSDAIESLRTQGCI